MDAPGTFPDPPRAPKAPPVSPQDALGPPEVYPRGPQGGPEAQGAPPGPSGLIQTHISTRAPTRTQQNHFFNYFSNIVRTLLSNIRSGSKKSMCLMKTKVVALENDAERSY